MSSAVCERQHRATRSGRCVAAAGLIAVTAALATLAFVLGINAGLVLVVNLTVACFAAALLQSVILETRQMSARERAELAARMATQARERSQENLRFATALGLQIECARVENAQLGARARELEARLSEAEMALAQVRDALWISEAAEKRARAAVLVAEQAGQAGRHLHPA